MTFLALLFPSYSRCSRFCFCPVRHVQKQLSENVFIDERRPVLLCDGKLCLRALQELFNLTIVEMMHGTLRVLQGFVFFFCIFSPVSNRLYYRASRNNTSSHCSPVSCSPAIIRSD